ncbi:YozQ family protein [Halalkalibacter akibai]|uniref:DUF4025 domain-containing protein n=1 Tax=Halalkalibacter akibai (strain ATCC 43226 / DSM 21942 / CIP 109018 / JCM 9157 / 1139) TaxID=1236973 RepID=W4QQ14_HALA3|nr:YozQ family protein [Halalkalibacter akibai]GAE33758.1 hypothetical protein JCM9157_782 [Halalkalibacter akibai JCM 9157]
MTNKKTPKANEVAEQSYQPEDYQSTNEVEKGLATTHEQVSDVYVEGTIDGKIDDYEGEDVALPRGNYEKDVFKEK